MAIAAEQVASYLEIAQGVHVMAIKAEERIPRILDLAGLQPVLQDLSASKAVGTPGRQPQLLH